LPVNKHCQLVLANGPLLVQVGYKVVTKYIDFDWEMDAMGIRLDTDLDVQKLGWKENDYFKLIRVDDRLQLVKVDEVEKFIRKFE
jgi:hypothetical protein